MAMRLVTNAVRPGGGQVSLAESFRQRSVGRPAPVFDPSGGDGTTQRRGPRSALVRRARPREFRWGDWPSPWGELV